MLNGSLKIASAHDFFSTILKIASLQIKNSPPTEAQTV
jgi:hypothetical protein